MILSINDLKMYLSCLDTAPPHSKVSVTYPFTQSSQSEIRHHPWGLLMMAPLPMLCDKPKWLNWNNLFFIYTTCPLWICSSIYISSNYNLWGRISHRFPPNYKKPGKCRDQTECWVTIICSKYLPYLPLPPISHPWSVCHQCLSTLPSPFLENMSILSHTRRHCLFQALAIIAFSVDPNCKLYPQQT